MGTQEEDEIIENPHPALDSLAVNPLRVSVDSPLAWNSTDVAIRMAAIPKSPSVALSSVRIWFYFSTLSERQTKARQGNDGNLAACLILLLSLCFGQR